MEVWLTNLVTFIQKMVVIWHYSETRHILCYDQLLNNVQPCKMTIAALGLDSFSGKYSK